MRPFLVALLLLVTGCATVGETALTAGTTGQNRFERADVDAGIAIARAAKDTVMEACFVAISRHLEVEPSTQAVGPVSAYALARTMARAARAGLADDVHLACAPLVVDAGSFASRLAVTLGR